MPSVVSTMSSLYSISEGSTFGVEREDNPPTVPRRRASGSQSIGTSEASNNNQLQARERINEDETDITGENKKRSSSTRDKNIRNISRSSHRSGRKRRSHSNRGDDKTELEVENQRESSKRKQRSRRSQSSFLGEPKDEMNGREDTNQEKISRDIPGRPTSNRSSSLSSHRPSKTSGATKEDQTIAFDERPKEESVEEGPRRKMSSRRSSSSSSRRDSSHRNNDDESSKDTVVGERRHRSSTSSGQHRRRHSHQSSHPSSRRSLSSSRRPSSVSSSSDWTSSSRSRDSGAQREQCGRSSSDKDVAEEDLEVETPGAYRISTHSTTRMMSSTHSTPWALSMSSSVSSSEHSFAMDEGEALTASTRSESYSRGGSLSLSTRSAMVRAEAAPDLTEEIATARDQGRTEAFAEYASRESSIVVVGVPQTRKSKAGNDARNGKKRRALIGYTFCCCLLVLVSGIIGYFTMIGGKENDGLLPVTPDQSGEDSELLADIRFDPPTADDCASVANGTEVTGQADMITKFIDMHIELTTDSEKDASFLVTLLKQQIQLSLMPLLIGCDEYVGNIIGNGVVDSVSNQTAPCLFRGNPNCVEVVLTIKIYLRRNLDGSVAVEIMNDLLLGKDLKKNLELSPSVETASVSLIVPSTNSMSNTSETPTWSPSMSAPNSMFGPPSPIPGSSGPTVEPITTTSNPSPTPTIRETLDPTSTPVSVPTSSPVLDYQSDITFQPAPVRITPQPTPSPSLQETARPTSIPTGRPTPGPTLMPIQGSTPLPTGMITPSPTASPTPVPTADPTQLPSKLPSYIPTIMPSRIPTENPSFTPSLTPSNGPSLDPSTKPTLVPSIPPSVCTSDTKIVPLFDEGDGAYNQVSPGEVSTEVQRFSCRAAATTDIGIVSFAEPGCTAECLFTIPFSSFESYCNSNPAGGFSFSIPGPFTDDSKLFIGTVADDFELTCGGQLSITYFDSSAIGCFADAQQRAMVGTERLTSSTMTVQQCLQRCFEAGFSYAGLEGRRDCFCDNDYMLYGKIEDSRCNRNCVADGMPCGGDWAMSVYPTGIDGHDGDYTPVPSVAPLGVLGCWQEDPAMIVTSLNPVWMGRCIDHCTSLGKTYAGLHNKNKCYCGDGYQAAGTAVTCDKDCGGPCGGTDSWSIYAT
ncbi:unnamed protein product [Cylindrotheca closterium]|uniref:WSC domain-containing protein n=1 Tax=Cylindrotheca closterium TaxID=2856 RepID=A0AAD2FFH8_9STRA|nr:unnamed protein product [Cylindrotheca closterium]